MCYIRTVYKYANYVSCLSMACITIMNLCVSNILHALQSESLRLLVLHFITTQKDSYKRDAHKICLTLCSILDIQNTQS